MSVGTAVVSGGKKPTYLMVDITPDDDCRGVEKLLKAKGWVNLARKLLPVKDAKKDELRDDAHPDMVIRNGTIEPAGKIVKAKTSTGGFTDEECFLPFDTVEKNMEFMRRFLWKPGVIGDLAAKKGQLEDPKNTVVSKPPEYPELLFISSHGYPNGAFQQHYVRKLEPEHDHDYHVVFEVPPVSSTQKWSGPKWVIFSACNALRPELAWQWSQAMRAPGGPRGILGFYSISPGPGGTVTYMTNWLANTAKYNLGASWARANEANPWAFLVFEDAERDMMSDWVRGGLTTPVNNATGKIVYYHKTEAKAGIDVEDLNPKKMLKGKIYLNASRGYEVPQGLEVGNTYTVVIAPPGGAWPGGAEAIEVSLVNLRENWWTGGKNTPDWKKMGASRFVNYQGKTGAIAASQMKNKFGNPAKGLPDTVVIPKSYFASASVKWVGMEFVVPPEAFAWFHGHAAQIWVKFEAVDASGKPLAKGSSIPQGLLPMLEAVEIEIE